MLRKEIVDILICPICASDIEYKDDKVICNSCKKYFPIHDNKPIMLVKEAREL